MPLSERVRRLLDTPVFQRLGDISQLGLVRLVYPGARHSRLEHSLGVYRNALLFLQTLSPQQAFSSIVGERAEEAFVVAALFHDVGHWPFCHAIEDMRLSDVPRHEVRVRAALHSPEIMQCLRSDWQCTADDVMSIIAGETTGKTTLSTDAVSLLSSCLSGPIDVDKLDYLVRDSLHAGVPYGRNFDASRLLSSLTVHPDRPRLAITEKGRTAAEMMVFARYIMFSEVYWHHAVRSATAMLQRLVFVLYMTDDITKTFDLVEPEWIATVCRAAEATDALPLANGLFGTSRQLYKRVAEFNAADRPELYRGLAHRPYWWLVACGNLLADRFGQRLGMSIPESAILIDAPPTKLEVDINVDVAMRNGSVKKLADVSPLADSLANRQFDGHVKRVRIFVRRDLRDAISLMLKDESLLRDAIETLDREVV